MRYCGGKSIISLLASKERTAAHKSKRKTTGRGGSPLPPPLSSSSSSPSLHSVVTRDGSRRDGIGQMAWEWLISCSSAIRSDGCCHTSGGGGHSRGPNRWRSSHWQQMGIAVGRVVLALLLLSDELLLQFYGLYPLSSGLVDLGLLGQQTECGRSWSRSGRRIRRAV